MKTFLHRKVMLVVWLAMVMSWLPCVAQFNYEINAPGSDEPAVWISTETVHQYGDWYNINCKVKWFKGFNISSVDLDYKTIRLYNPVEDGDYFVATYTLSQVNVNNLLDGTERADADITYSAITDIVELKNIFSCYSADPVEIVNGEIITSGEIEGPYHSNPSETLYFQNPSPIVVQLGGAISHFNLDVNSDLTLNGNNKYLSKTGDAIFLHSGNLLLQGQRINLESLSMDGGNLIFDGADGENAKIKEIDAKGGTITVKNHLGVYFDSLTIDGNVTVNAENPITMDNLKTYDYGKINKISIVSGDVSLTGASAMVMVIDNANVSLNNYYFRGGSNTGSADIILESGSLVLDDSYSSDSNEDYGIEVRDGLLTVKDGWYERMNFLHVTGNGNVIIENGIFHYYESDGGNTLIHQDGGNLAIKNGYFYSSGIYTEAGTLTIEGGTFKNNSILHLDQLEGEEELELVVNGNTDINISGGFFNNGIYFAPNLDVQPEDLLVSGYEFCKEYNGYYNEPVTEMQDTQSSKVPGKCLLFNEVRKQTSDVSSCLEIARKANIGPEGTDVKMIKTRLRDERWDEYYYEYEIYTPVGLIWFAALRNGVLGGTEYDLDDSNSFCDANGDWLTQPYLFELGKPAVKIMKDLDMSGYDWVPFSIPYILFDGQGHTISNLSVTSQLYSMYFCSNSGILANLIIKNWNFVHVHKLESNAVPVLSILAGYNDGTIVNCGVQQSSISYKGTDLSSSPVIMGGLAAINRGFIYNNYVCNDFSISIEASNSFSSEYVRKYYSNSDIELGGLIGSNERTGLISNNYFVGKIDYSLDEEIKENFKVNINEICPDSWGKIENCYISPSLETLNENVASRSIPKGEMEWSNWIISADVNGGNPIHQYNNESIVLEDNPSHIISVFTILKEGKGEFKATYEYQEDPENPESIKTGIIYADTAVKVVNDERFTLTAIPADGYELVKVVEISKGKETEIPDIKAGEEFAYNIVVADSLKAYFKEKEAEPIASKFTILKEGSGEFKATYTYLKDINDPNSAVDTIIYANTFVEVINNEDFTITATPSEGYELDRVVKILNGEEVDTLDMKVGEPLEYNVVASDTLKAYFKEIELIPEEPEIITTDSILTSDQVNGDSLIVAGGTATDTLELNVSNISIPSLTINANSVVSLSISGDNNLGKIENKGTLVIQNNDGNLDVEIENKGIFIDYTGTITKVSSFSINSIDDETVKEGETVTLVASASIDNNVGNVIYQWQRFVDNVWVDVNTEPMQTRAAIIEDKPNELIVSSSETGAYRCLITYKNEGVSTTLTAYAEVSLDASAPEDPDEDTDEPDDSEDTSRPDDTPTYYNVKVDDVCEGVEVQLSNTVVKEGNQISVYIKVAEGYDAENLKVYFKQSLFNYWEEVKEGVQPGEYIIYNVWADISIKVEGAVKEEPTGIDHLEGVKVYAKDGSIYVYTPNREEVVILNMTGAIVKSEEQVGLVQYDGLERGIYIIRIGDKVFKIKN